MTILYYILLVTYALVLIYITVYCLMQFHLLYHYGRHRPQNRQVVDQGASEAFGTPKVTVQLPIYNEQYVVERLIDAVAAFDYPTDKLEIQILDDSTDETVGLVDAKCAVYRQKGFKIDVIRREKRTGYKAGALRDAMPFVGGDYIAIFDADFLPRPDFLRKTIPYFSNPKVGVVQTRWEHINQEYSLITRLQALQLNVHFTVEQKGRLSADYLLQFNGTGGVWRKETIADAGGWHDDTLTEDLDLSVRAQLKDWKILYLEDVSAPAELPAEMSGFKSQQYRWMKGGAETAKKMLPNIWRSSFSWPKKLHATLHLLGSTVFVFVFMLGVLSVPLLLALQALEISSNYFSFFIVGTLAIISVYYVANISNSHTNPDRHWARDMGKFLVMFPLFLSMSMGLSLHNTVAVIQGYLGKKSAFVRTPKFAIRNISDRLNKRKYLSGKLSWTTIVEGLLSLYFLFAIALGIYIDDWSLILFHLLLAFGYGAIFYFSVKHLSYGR